MLVSVVNAGDEAVDGPVAIPVRASALDRVVWGNGTWTVADDGGVRLGGATAMSTNMILLRGAKGRHG
ncbi:hypothetical protein CDD83_6447 [Cordyceps sp. RAO-2017]|nr:hypothetical protein CDD83_6447 [Cordyceps sp. RAO-2017]